MEEKGYTIRKSTAEDVEGIIDCLRNVYAEDYQDVRMYDPQYVSGLVGDHLPAFVVAVVEDVIAGITLVRDFQEFSGAALLGTMCIRHGYRRRGISTSVTTASIAFAAENGCIASYVDAVTMYDYSQRVMLACGFVPCGFDFAAVEMGTLQYRDYRNSKLITVNALIPAGNASVQRLYYPEKYDGYIRGILENLHITLQRGTPAPAAGHAQMRMVEMEAYKVTHCYIHQGGTDFPHRLDAYVAAYLHRPRYAINAYVDMENAGAPEVMQTLESRGFFFAGITPLTAKGSFAIFHHPLHNQIYWEDIHVAPEIDGMLKSLHGFYGEREALAEKDALLK